jgi:hypothetical protein
VKDMMIIKFKNYTCFQSSEYSLARNTKQITTVQCNDLLTPFSASQGEWQ